MTSNDILNLRIYNQKLTHSAYTSPQDLIVWFGAVQAQDFPGASVEQRLQKTAKQTITQAFNKGDFLRTHVMRPTWHFVSPQDISWLLSLTAPHVKKTMASYNKKLELTPDVFTKTQKIIVQELQDKKQLTRKDIKSALTKHKILTDVQRLAHLIMEAELEQIICSGQLQANEFTYMLFSDRVNDTTHRSREEALSELTKRYFQSHGPAQLQDFVWWSGLPTGEARKGIEMNNLTTEIIANKTYYYFASENFIEPTERCFLLPNYDEYTVAYSDRSLFFNSSHSSRLDARGNSIFQHVIVFDREVIGVWKRIINKHKVEIQSTFFRQISNLQRNAFHEAVEKYATFLGLQGVIL